MEGFKVKCQTCGQVLYETTKNYNCHKPLTGDMLRLLPLYKDWPCYDGALATESTPRFLMFCSQCAGYISTTGKLTFVDFPDKRVTEVSRERSEIGYNEVRPLPKVGDISGLHIIDMAKGINELEGGVTIFGKKELAALPTITAEGINELQKMDPELMTPEDMMKKLDEQSREDKK